MGSEATGPRGVVVHYAEEPDGAITQQMQADTPLQQIGYEKCGSKKVGQGAELIYR